MNERFRVGYSRLFEIRILHHYWLDEAAKTFEDITDDSIREDRLLRYDARRIIEIAPRRSTSDLISGLGGAFRATGLGAVVAVPDDARLASDAEFEFHLTVVDPAYGNYTALTLEGQSIVSVTDPNTHAVHRYKANVPELSNLDGTSRGSGAAKRLFLSREYGINGDRIENLTTAGANLRMRTAQAPSSSFQVLGPTAALPVFVHQGDVPPIVPPANTSGAPPRGVELDDDTPTTVAAKLRVVAVRDSDSAFDLVDANGQVRTPHPIFEVHLCNRWTVWRYRNRGDRSVIETATSARPLTHFGSVGTRPQARPDAVIVEFAASGTQQRVARLVSEVFV